MREDDRKKFVELATKRVNTAIKAIQLVGNLSNRSNYDYTESDVEKIFSALNKELRSCKERFQTTSKNGKSFRLD